LVGRDKSAGLAIDAFVNPIEAATLLDGLASMHGTKGIVNVSQVITEGSASADSFTTNQYMSAYLFVAAADGCGGKCDIDLTGPPRPPTSYLANRRLSSNIIGVTPLSKAGAAYGKYDQRSTYVQLAAPGEEVLGAVGEHDYIRTSGSSAATAEVTAAAAWIAAQAAFSPLEIKGRLIYSADWLSNLPIWGGGLNMRRAITRLQETILVLPGDRRKELEIDLGAADLSPAFSDGALTLINATKQKSDDQDETWIKSRVVIRHKDVLRVSRSIGPRAPYRVIYLEDLTDPGQCGMRIATAERLEGSFAYRVKQTLDLDTGALSSGDGTNQPPIEWAEVYDFTARMKTLTDRNFRLR
jgi:hypothetical protein